MVVQVPFTELLRRIRETGTISAPTGPLPTGLLPAGPAAPGGFSSITPQDAFRPLPGPAPVQTTAPPAPVRTVPGPAPVQTVLTQPGGVAVPAHSAGPGGPLPEPVLGPSLPGPRLPPTRPPGPSPFVPPGGGAIAAPQPAPRQIPGPAPVQTAPQPVKPDAGGPGSQEIIGWTPDGQPITANPPLPGPTGPPARGSAGFAAHQAALLDPANRPPPPIESFPPAVRHGGYDPNRAGFYADGTPITSQSQRLLDTDIWPPGSNLTVGQRRAQAAAGLAARGLTPEQNREQRHAAAATRRGGIGAPEQPLPIGAPETVSGTASGPTGLPSQAADPAQLHVGDLIRKLMALTPRQYFGLLPNQKQILASVVSQLGVEPDDFFTSLERQAPPGVNPASISFGSNF